jgi:uncharacterized coiled-coil DUF342 family protein
MKTKDELKSDLDKLKAVRPDLATEIKKLKDDLEGTNPDLDDLESRIIELKIRPRRKTLML